MDTMKAVRPKLCTSNNVIRASCLCIVATTLVTILVVLTMNRYEKVAVDKVADLFEKLPDSGTVEIPLNDPSVIEASEILRQYISSYRSTNCSSLIQHNEAGTVKYAKRTVLDIIQYIIHYSVEVSFDDEVFFSRFRLLPYNESNFCERRLELISTTPAPCSTQIQDQLAISAQAVEEINSQNLSWTAIYNPRYEGMMVKQFGLGYIPLATSRRKLSEDSLNIQSALSQTPAATASEAAGTDVPTTASPEHVGSSADTDSAFPITTAATSDSLTTSAQPHVPTTTPDNADTTLSTEAGPTTSSAVTSSAVPMTSSSSVAPATSSSTAGPAMPSSSSAAGQATPSSSSAAGPATPSSSSAAGLTTSSSAAGPATSSSTADPATSSSSAAGQVTSSASAPAPSSQIPGVAGTTSTMPPRWTTSASPRPTAAALATTATPLWPSSAPATTPGPVDFTPPVAFDARDTRPGQEPCKAFDPLDQGVCNSCYAFAAASAFSARLCRAGRGGSVGNVVVAPQSLMDCTNGCNGGDPRNVFVSLTYQPAVEGWCDPYLLSKQACGSNCGAGISYGAVPGSVRLVGGATAYGTRQMMLELIRGGPGVVSMLVLNDLFGYGRGVYTPSAAAQPVGGHSVSLVGWGEDRGAPYWLLQNSWGAGWGEQGYFRVARGPHRASIEPSGLLVIKPLVPDACPDSACAPGSTTRKDCTCQCPFGRVGPTCSQCALNCTNGGVLDEGCTRCECPVGFWGRQCESGYSLAPLASCTRDSSQGMAVTYSFSGTALPPTQTSFVGVYQLNETSPFRTAAMAYICGSVYPKYISSVNGGLCPPSGSFRLNRPMTPGKYKIVVSRYSPPNALGQSGYYALEDGNIIGYYTVLQSDCTPSALADALNANSPGTLLAAEVNATSAGLAARSVEMKARLDSVQPLLSALLAEPQPSLAMARPGRIVWQGTPTAICYSVPPSANVNPKILVIYMGGQATGTSYPTGLGATKTLPPAPAGCVNITVARGIPTGRYTLLVEDPTNGGDFAAWTTIDTERATVAIAGVVKAGNVIAVTITWGMPGGLATPLDTVRVFDSRGQVVYWFYTGCKCQGPAGPVTAASGSFTFRLSKGPPGGFTFELFPGGGAISAALAPDWVPWDKMGW